MTQRSLFNPYEWWDNVQQQNSGEGDGGGGGGGIRKNAAMGSDVLRPLVAYESKFDAHNWAEALEDVSARSVFVSITPEEAVAMCAVYSDEVMCELDNAPSQAQHLLLDGVGKKIAAAFASFALPRPHPPPVPRRSSSKSSLKSNGTNSNSSSRINTPRSTTTAEKEQPPASPATTNASRNTSRTGSPDGASDGNAASFCSSNNCSLVDDSFDGSDERRRRLESDALFQIGRGKENGIATEEIEGEEEREEEEEEEENEEILEKKKKKKKNCDDDENGEENEGDDDDRHSSCSLTTPTKGIERAVNAAKRGPRSALDVAKELEKAAAEKNDESNQNGSNGNSNSRSGSSSSSSRRRRKPPTSFFVRLSSRGCRDACLNVKHPWFRDSFRSEMNKIRRQNFEFTSSHNPENEGAGEMDEKKKKAEEPLHLDEAHLKSLAVIRTAASLLRIETPQQALWLLTHSRRVYADLMRALHCSNSQLADWDVQICIREWKKADPLLEMRGVVFGGELVAIMQYSHLYCVPWADWEACARACVDYYNRRVRKRIPGPLLDCVIDFGICPSSSSPSSSSGETNPVPRLFLPSSSSSTIPHSPAYRVWVIELNPYGPSTSLPLLSWENDRRLLQGNSDAWGDLEEWERVDSNNNNNNNNNNNIKGKEEEKSKRRKYRGYRPSDSLGPGAKEVVGTFVDGLPLLYLKRPLPLTASKILSASGLTIKSSQNVSKKNNNNNNDKNGKGEEKANGETIDVEEDEINEQADEFPVNTAGDVFGSGGPRGRPPPSSGEGVAGCVVS